MARDKGKLWVIEGPDLAGKDTVLDTMKGYAQDIDKRVFDVREFWLKMNRHPSLFEIMEYGTPDLLVFAEPSTVNIGKLVRSTYIVEPEKNGIGIYFPAKFVAGAFALDREEMIYSFVSPARKEGINILSGRNYLSSLLYQPLHAKFFGETEEARTLPKEYIVQLPGNQLAMSEENSPDEILIVSASAEQLEQRKNARTKKDNSSYEGMDFLETLVLRYLHYYRDNPLEKTGVALSYHETMGSKEDTVAMARREAARLFLSAHKFQDNYIRL